MITQAMIEATAAKSDFVKRPGATTKEDQAAECLAAPINPDEINLAFDWSEQWVSGPSRLWVNFGRAWLLASYGLFDEAGKVIEKTSASVDRFDPMYVFMEQYVCDEGGVLARFLKNRVWPFPDKDSLESVTSVRRDVYFWLPELGVIWTDASHYPRFHVFSLNRELVYLRENKAGGVVFMDGNREVNHCL